MTEPETESDAALRSVAVLNWSRGYDSLLEALAAAAIRGRVSEIVCVGDTPTQEIRSRAEATGVAVRWVRDPSLDDLDEYDRVLRDEARVQRAVAVIVLPRRRADEPDALSRICCESLRRAGTAESKPNIIVEVKDPEAAYEFHGLGVATVFYSGYLRAALLGQACVDLGVFQFVYGLLTGAFRVVALPVAQKYIGLTFADAAMEVETDEDGRPITLIGVQTQAIGADGGDTPALTINPGPRFPLERAFALLALTSTPQVTA